jgi:methylthioribose-1-phosphate isomerase
VIETVRWKDGRVAILDQRRLPDERRVLACESVEEVAEAIETLAVRGAPAIGIAAAYGVALAARLAGGEPRPFQSRAIREASERLGATRPTAVNLGWALSRMRRAHDALGESDPATVERVLLEEADRILEEDLEASRRMAEAGSVLVPDGARVLTHCNTGGLATGGLGTALSLVTRAHATGRKVSVLVDETRPLLQGSRLTAWELTEAGVPHRVLVDAAAAWAIARGLVDLVVIGADRVARNGDTANKVGSYGVALAARAHAIPFYVVAPASSFDPSLASGSAIPIEERSGREVTRVGERRVAPEGATAFNPAFDVTPGELVAAFVTEAGIFRPPYDFTAERLAGGGGP